MTPDDVRAALPPRGLPAATLLVGPGAFALARQIRAERGLPGADVAELDLEAARGLREQACILPLRGDEKALAVQLDGASPRALDLLLRVLEEPPRAARFLLAAEQYPPPVIATRCSRFTLSGPRRRPAPDPAVRAAVAAALRAARAGHPPAEPRGWTAAHSQLLCAWAAEHAAGRFRSFGPEFAKGVTRRQALRVLTEMTARPGARAAPVAALQAAFG